MKFTNPPRELRVKNGRSLFVFTQTDYDRHLEELLERVETLLAGILRRKLKKENLDQLARYHALLENVRHLSTGSSSRHSYDLRFFYPNSGAGGTMEATMSTETKLFLRKTKELSRLVSTMKELEVSRELGTELLQIEKKLADLSVAVEKDKCLNAGGKFEWVDSVLVKCLRNGTWLLLDQVNLCSPAILDRLNGLLEPNGALTIGEKGVDEDGNVFTVKAHGNFRLFLTMDPRHGEISRAMRNRGVEISIPAPRHFVPSNNSLDVMSLLNSCGIRSVNRQKLLLKVHGALHGDQYRLNEMLQVALFTSQQTSKGFAFEQSLRNSYRELCGSLDARSKHEALRKIDETLSEVVEDEKPESFYDLDAMSLRTCDLRRNARLAIVKQQGFLLKLSLEKLLRNDDTGAQKIDLHDFFDRPPIADATTFLRQLLLDFYERSSLDDLQTRRLWCRNILQWNKFNKLAEMNECLGKEVGNMEFLFRGKSALGVPLNLIEPPTFSNNLVIALYFRLISLDCDSERDLHRDKDVMYLKEYSSAVCSGRLSTNLKNEPLILQFAEMADHFGKIIETILRDENLSINDREYVELRDDLKWYQRFRQIGETKLIDKSRGVFLDVREISSHLNVHYKWLTKFIKKLLALSGARLESSSDLAEKYLNMAIDADKYRRIRKKIKKLLFVPSPHISENSMIFHERLRSISRKLEIVEEDLIDSLRTKLKVVSVSSPENLIVRKSLIEICVECFESQEADDTTRIEEMTKDVLEVKEISIRREDFVEIEIWPIYEFFFFLFAYRFQRRFCDEFSDDFKEETRRNFEKNFDKGNQMSVNLVDCHVETAETTGENFGRIYKASVFRKFEDVPTIPPRLIGLIKALNANKISTRRRISLLPELLFSVEEFAERSFAVKNSSILLHWYDNEEDETEENFNIFQTNFINKSSLYDLIFELFLTKSGSKKEMINFGNYKNQRRVLQTVQTLLWRNSLILNSDEFDISTNDSILLQFLVDYYLSVTNKVTDTFPLKLNTEEQSNLEDRLFKPIRLLQEIKGKLENENNVIERGNGWLILGYLQIFLFHDLGPIDPVQKIALKSKYIQENIAELEHLMRVEDLQSVILGTSLSKERKASRANHLRTLSSEARSFENIRAVRPSSSFQNLKEEIENFSSNVGSFESIFKQIGQLNELAEQHLEMGSQASHREKLHEAIIWKKSLERFSGKLEKNFLVGFPDLVSPVISAVSNLHHGLSILIHELSNREFRNSSSDVCYSLLRFPVVGSCQENYINLARLCSSEKLIFILTKQLKSNTVQKDRFTMIKIALKELENLSLVRNDVESLWEELNGIFFKIRILWKEQEKQREEQMKEKESLFKMKSTKEEEESDFKNMFPGYQEDFLELAEVFPDSHRDLSELQKISENISSDEESFVEVISMKDARKIQEIHWNILRNCSPRDSNLKRPSMIVSRRSGNNLESSVSNLEPNFIDPLIQRLELLGSSVKTWPESLSSQLVCCLNVLISKKCNFDSGNDNDREVYDFYKDPNVPEIEQCQPLFDRLCEKISEFLKEWPENPILNSIKLIVDRLFSFSIDSSLSRFLVGVELLLTKIKQWEENARLDVSLAEFIESFGEKVLRWRKLEISRWKDSLEVLEDDLKTWASKWWFFLFNLVDQYLAEDVEAIEDSSKSDNVSKGKMIESLERFLVESSLIEFETRLQLVYLFYQHIDHLEETKRQKELLAIFWNIYFYYYQFLDDVQNKIKALKEPIAKKLKDTIKITRWNDISYWSVKNTAEKTRRTLHKFVKEFRKGLEQNVASYLTLKTKVVESLETSSRRELRPSDFLVSLESRRLQKTEKLAGKARQFCENIIERSGYSEIRRDIETFVEESLEESKRLRSLEVDKTLAKSKQQAQLKSLLQQKKLALANYFKALSGLGVSYRIGILTWKNRKSEITNFTSVPLDLQEMQNFEFKSKYVNIDKGLFEQWSGCNKYYYESLVKLNFLDGILNSGKGNLDMQNAERCHGFSIHLALLAHRQKETIANFFKRFLPFRIQVSNLALMVEDIMKNTSNDIPEDTTKITGSGKLDVPVQRNLQTAMNNLQELLEVLQMSMKQIVIFLESYPTESLAQEETLLDLNETAVPVLRESNVPKASVISMKVSRKIEKSGQVFLFHQKHADFLQLSYQEINEVKKQLVDLRCSFTLDHPISKNLNFLIEKIESSNELFTSTIEQSAESGDSSEYKVKLDKLVTQILLVVQRKLQDSQKLIEERNDAERESPGSFEENLMTERLIEPLKKVVPDLRLNTISKILGELLQIIHECDVKSANDCTKSLSQHLPLLEQYTLFLHYYLHEQVASFRLTCKFLYLQLNVFLDLATNGFCQPENLDTPEDDQEGGGTAEGGMGLADGEGQKDVSERIETEDQLEEARNPNEEEKDNERKDVEENEKGIEMSENFEGHMQDLEQREEEENDEEDDDLDKEMGETDETAEKLDEEIWKDEEEEEEDENEDKGNEKEERGTGEKTGQEELSAKDTDENKNKDEDEEREADGERKENERKEINEFEEPEVNEDQVDPYHGQNQPEIEPESFELPEDVNLDEETKEDNPEGEEENPFDIDQMKESAIPEEKENGSENKEEPEEDKQRDSSDEDVNEEEGEKNENTDADKRRDEKVTDPEKDKENDTEEGNIEEENRTEEDKAPPSFDAGSKEIDASQEVESRKDGSRDAVESQSNEEQMEIDPTENSADDKRDTGTGQSQTEEREGHSGSKQEENVPISGKDRSSKPVQKRRKPGESDENRSLLDSETQPSAKKLKTAMQDLDSQEERERDDGVGGESETYEHIKNAEKFDDYVFDAATEEQIKKQAFSILFALSSDLTFKLTPQLIYLDEKDQMDDQLKDNDIEMHEEPESKNEEEETKKEQSQKLSENKKDKSANARGEKSNDVEQIETGGEVEGEMVETSRVLRGNESTIHTKLSELECSDLPVDITQKRSEIESMLGQWSRGPSSMEATNAWSSISALTESAARELSEKLRLVLEPTLTSRLKGFYRTGKRINMRKVIPYIASEFRKDKIWLRRTKPAKRDYQIVLAIDDSSSMADNRSKELAFESLSLIGKAMTYLEVGQLAVVNFGERVNVLHPFGENFTEESGAR
ncbi:hypothetical protein E2986_02010 [Frieseomelitta varia]|uniref:ATPase dynein-related AAA domain-containing protein n=1 Tax=Frieseomelitta varia TaxID=561572 RepID=A0A833W5I5_9HYME|nr:hypothetical protein E2986_02010 [Frieseomelitta varia]